MESLMLWTGLLLKRFINRGFKFFVVEGPTVKFIIDEHSRRTVYAKALRFCYIIRNFVLVFLGIEALGELASIQTQLPSIVLEFLRSGCDPPFVLAGEEIVRVYLKLPLFIGALGS